MDDSWTDSNLNRVSVIQFQEETKAEEEEDDEAAAERRVSSRWGSGSEPLFGKKWTDPTNGGMTASQGLQRRATPHPSELKVMKKVIEERRNEAFTSRPDGEESTDAQVKGTRSAFSPNSLRLFVYRLALCFLPLRPGEATQRPVQSEPRLPGLQQHSVGQLRRGPTQTVTEGGPGGRQFGPGGGAR